MQENAAAFGLAVAFCNFVAKLLAQFVLLSPNLPYSRRGKAAVGRIKKRPPVSAPEDPHTFVPWQGRWRCVSCLAVVKKLASKRALTSCRQASAKIRSISLEPQGHHILVGEFLDGAFFLGCMRRGAWCTHRPVKLAGPCMGRGSM